MVGQGSPIIRCSPAQPERAKRSDWRYRRIARSVVALAICVLFQPSGAGATPASIRLRLAWGGNSQAPQQWTGRIAVEAGLISNLQPLGMQPDEPGALLLVNNEVRIVPQSKRTFDWCDISITAERSAELIVELQSDPLAEPTTVRIPLAQLASKPFRTSLDESENILLIHRAPGDNLAVSTDRKTLIFAPGETWDLKLHPDLATGTKSEEVHVNIRLRAHKSDVVLWESQHVLPPNDGPQPTIPLAVPCPTEEGVYRLSITANRPQRFAERLVPGKNDDLIASRDVELVVVDPAAKSQPLVDRWLPLLTLNPANPSLWKRLPVWAKLARIPGLSPAVLGSVRPVVRPHPNGALVELPAATEGKEPAWQAYTLPVNLPNEPHLLEIEYPANLPLNMSISIIEPNAAGRVTSSGRETAIYSEASSPNGDPALATHRIVFWPRTNAPLLLIANRHASQPGQYGKISLSQPIATSPATSSTGASDTDSMGTDAKPNSTRLVAAYVARPKFAENFGAAEVLDPGSGLSVDSWSTFLDGSRRLAKFVRYSEQNGILVSVAANGSALYPSERLGTSPRYDTGMLATTAPDPIRKDVLELLLRIADREELRIIPTLQLTSPLPQLEALRLGQNAQQTGLEWVDYDGHVSNNGNHQSTFMSSEFGCRYNPLNSDVQNELELIISELVDRYSHHTSLAGVAIQLSGNGVTMLPGLAWGFDDHTVQQFSQETKIAIAGEGAQRFRQRAEQLLGKNREAWQHWRRDQLTALYRRLSERVGQARQDLRLVLTTEEIFSGETAQRELRQAIASKAALDQVLIEHGIDLYGLSELEGITVLRPYRLSATEPLGQNTLDLTINRAEAIDRSLLQNSGAAGLLYQLPSRVRLASFDAQSPFGKDQTHLTLLAPSAALGGASRRQLMTLLTRQDIGLFVTGGEQIPVGVSSASQKLFRTFRQLPTDAIAERTVAEQPITMRVYQEAEATVVCLINEAPWAVDVELPIRCREPCLWKKLGAAPGRADSNEPLAEHVALQGAIEAGSSVWPVEVAPFDLVAWRYTTSDLQIGEPKIRIQPVAAEYLVKRIEEIEVRTKNLDIQRPYNQLQNPGFELEDANAAIVGWQPELGNDGTIEQDQTTKHSGNKSLHMVSKDTKGVAVQSHSFAMPTTGQLALSMYVRAEHIDKQSHLQLILEDDTVRRTYRRTAMLDAKALNRKQLQTHGWAMYEFSVNDIPLDTERPMRVQFILSGPGEVWIDDVELCDLRFTDSERVDLVKRMFAARRALDQERLMDCLRLVDDYGPRYLVEHVPPAAASNVRLAKPPQRPNSEEKPAESQGFGERIKGLMPRLLR